MQRFAGLWLLIFGFQAAELWADDGYFVAPAWEDSADAIVPAGDFLLAGFESQGASPTSMHEQLPMPQHMPSGGMGYESSGQYFEGPPTHSALPSFVNESVVGAGPVWVGPPGRENGTNPAEYVRSVLVTNHFVKLKNGGNLNTSLLQFKWPIYHGRGGLLFEAPYSTYDHKRDNMDRVGGFGDLKGQVNYSVYTTSDNTGTLVAYLEAFIPSADDKLLSEISNSNDLTVLDIGTRRYVLGPGIGYVWAPLPNFFFAETFFYEFDVAGNDRDEVSRIQARWFAMYAWENGFYIMPEIRGLSNHVRDDQDYAWASEVGFTANRTTFYAKTDNGLSSDGIRRDWGVEFGVRMNY